MFGRHQPGVMPKRNQPTVPAISVSAVSSPVARGSYTTADIERMWTNTVEVNRRAPAMGDTAAVEPAKSPTSAAAIRSRHSYATRIGLSVVLFQ